MKVYIVIAEIQDSGFCIYGVFDTKTKAQAVIDNWDEHNDPKGYAWNRDDLNIYDEEVQ